MDVTGEEEVEGRRKVREGVEKVGEAGKVLGGGEEVGKKK